jgi:membrane-associated phospholipid phosphatase
VNYAARFISLVLHPLLMATYLFSLFAFVFPVGLEPLKGNMHWNIIFLIFTTTFALPALNVGLLKTMGRIQSLSMPGRKERILPFLFITALYIGFTYFLYVKTRVSIQDNLFRFLLIIDVLVVTATFATLFYKVSVHSLAWWGLVGILFPLNNLSEEGTLFLPSVVVLVLAGLVMSARLQLNAHTPREVMVGAILGLASGFISMSVLF